MKNKYAIAISSLFDNVNSVEIAEGDSEIEALQSALISFDEKEAGTTENHDFKEWIDELPVDTEGFIIGCLDGGISVSKPVLIESKEQRISIENNERWIQALNSAGVEFWDKIGIAQERYKPIQNKL